jgi:glycosyltransferase involved in cell wall biosynthesis
VLWLGTYERDYPRNRVLIDGLAQIGVAVAECHAPLWEGREHKADGALAPGRIAALALAAGGAWASVLRRQAALPRPAALVAGYPSQPDAPIVLAVARARRVPLVVDAMIALSDAMADRGRAGRAAAALALLDRLAFRHADLVVADTEANARWLTERFSLPPERVAAVPVGADPVVFAPAPEPEGPPRMLFVGKLAPLHGIDVVLAAARRPGAPALRIIGDGQLGPWLAAELRRAPPPGVEHVPWVPFRELGDEVRAAGICLGVFGASERVGRVVPNKVWQAMAAGRAIVTADGPAPREVLRDGVDALLVPAADPAALADAVERLAADPALRARLGASARARYLELGAPAAVARTFATALARRTRRG